MKKIVCWGGDGRMGMLAQLLQESGREAVYISGETHVKGGGKAAVHRSAAYSGAQTLDVRLRRCYSGMRPAK